MPASPIRKLIPYAEAAKERGIKVYHLNIGQPDIKTPEVALDAIHNLEDRVLAYSHSAGIESLLKGLAAYYRNLGIDIGYEDIIITTGGSEAIVFAMMACLNEGEEILVPEPFYANYNGFAIEAGVVIKPVHSTIENDFAMPAMSVIEKNITERTKAVLLCNPNNPTGYLYSKEELYQLRDIVKKHDLFLLCDEVYREFCYDGEKHYSSLMLEGIGQNVVMIDSLSKRYSMCGVRLGALVSRNRAVIDMALRLGQARLCAPYVAQVAGEAALNTPQSYFDEVYDEYLSRRNFLVDALNKIEGVYCPRPKGAFYSVVKLPVDDADKFAQWMLEHFSYEGQTVMVAPASGFYATEGLGKNEVRVAYVLNKTDLAAAVKCLEEGLKAYNAKKL